MRRRQQSRRARNGLLWGLGTFVALQLATTGVLESWLPQFRDPYFAFKLARLRSRIDAARRTPAPEAGAGPPVVVLMVGSSHVSDALRGTLVESDLARRLGRPVVLYNFGVPGDNPLNQLLNFERLLAQGVRPDLLLVEVMPALLHSNAAATQLQVMPAERFGLRDRWVLRQHHLPRRFDRYSWQCWGLPWYAHRLEILSVLVPHFLPGFLRQDWARGCDESGWIPPPYENTPESRAAAVKHAAGAYGPTLSQFQLGNPFCDALGHLLERCHQERIGAALVLMPEGSTFRGYYSADALNQVDAFLKKLAAPHGTPVIDARTWVPDDGFFDSHHLLPDGAAVFTTRLRDEVLRLLRVPPLAG